MGPDDEGKLNLTISCGPGVVKLDFGRSVRWIAMLPEEALSLSVTLASLAGTAKAAAEQKKPTILSPDGKPT
jgi:hypothetical protein